MFNINSCQLIFEKKERCFFTLNANRFFVVFCIVTCSVATAPSSAIRKYKFWKMIDNEHNKTHHHYQTNKQLTFFHENWWRYNWNHSIKWNLVVAKRWFKNKLISFFFRNMVHMYLCFSEFQHLKILQRRHFRQEFCDAESQLVQLIRRHGKRSYFIIRCCQLHLWCFSQETRVTIFLKIK